MKFGPKGMRFVSPVMNLLGKCLTFVGRQNSLQLEETALVIDGDAQRFFLPFFEWFVRGALAKRTLVTVPYSRIVFARRRRYLVGKTFWWLGGLGVYGWLLFETKEAEMLFFFAVVFGLTFLLLGVLVHLLLRPRFHLVYRQANGNKCRVCFRFTSRKLQREFVRRLEANRVAARRAVTAPAGPAIAATVIQGGPP